MKIIVDDRLTTFMCLREIYSIVNCFFWFPYSESFAVRGLQALIWTTSGSGLAAAGGFDRTDQGFLKPRPDWQLGIAEQINRNSGSLTHHFHIPGSVAGIMRRQRSTDRTRLGQN